MTQQLRAVLFDIDGTLIDSNDAHASAWFDTFAEFGYDVSYDAIRTKIGMGGDKLLPACIDVEEESERGKALGERRGEIFKTRYLPKIEPLHRVREMLEAIRDAGFELAVATSATEDELSSLLSIANANDLFEETTTKDDVEESKPDPDVIHAALAKLGVKPSEAIMVGDTPYDIAAAAKAGVRSVAFRSGGWGDADLTGAEAIYDGPADLLRNLETSPIRM